MEQRLDNNKIRLLIIERDQTSRDILKSLLIKLNYETYANSEKNDDVSLLINRTNPDIILLDISIIEDKTCSSMAEKLKGIPVIFTADRPDGEMLKKIGNISSYGYILKPYDINKIDIAVNLAYSRLKYEKELLKSEKRFKNIFNGIPIGVIIINIEEQTIKDINTTALKILKYNRNEIVNKNYNEYLNTMNNETKKMSGQIESSLLTRDKVSIPVLKNVFSLSEEDENIRIYCFMDISKQKENEEIFKKKTEELNQTVTRLYGLFAISNIVENSTDAVELLEKVIEIFPNCFVSENSVSTKIVYNDVSYKSKKFKESKWKLTEKIDINEYESGELFIYFPNQNDDSEGVPLFFDEIYLLKTVAGQIETALRKLVMAKDIKYKAEFENIIARYSTRFINLPIKEIDREISKALDVVGNFIKIDKINIYQISKEDELIENTFTWQTKEKDIKETKYLQKNIEFWIKKLSMTNNIHIPSVEVLDEYDQSAKNILTSQEIKSVLILPLHIGDKLIGIMKLDSIRNEKRWSDEDINLLSLLAETIANTIEKKIAIQKLTDMNSQLMRAQANLVKEEKLAAIGKLAAGVAHELNNPIGFISSNFRTMKKYVSSLLAYIEFLEGKITLNPGEVYKNDENVKYIRDDINNLISESTDGFRRVTNIIDNLKRFSRIDHSEKKEYFDINEMIESTLVVAHNTIKYTCTVETELNEVPKIYCRGDEISQVLLNLIINAVQAIAEQKRNEMGKILITTYEETGFVCCKITDDGPGVPEKIIGKIFDPFFTTKPVGEGTGLGLNISYDIIVNKHKGKLYVENNIESGSSFFIKLPPKKIA